MTTHPTETVQARDLQPGDRIVLFPGGIQDTIMPIISVSEPSPSKWGDRVFIRWGEPEGDWVILSDRYVMADAQFHKMREATP